MTEEKTAQTEPKSPYDLWPNEDDMPQEYVEPTFVQLQHDPFASVVEPQARASFDSPFAQPEEKFDAPFEAPFVPVAYTPESPDEAVRQRGLAFSVGVVFFGSVAFMLFLGWLADLILGSSPWGIVIGIVLGAVIGFLQFFRITSQIFNKPSDLPKQNPLLSRNDDIE